MSEDSPLNQFAYRGSQLYAESVALAEIAEKFGTPCYVYSRAALIAAYREFDSAFGERAHLICYAVKANPNLAILNVLAQLGSGFDIVSGGELARVLKAGGDARKIVFSGVGKTAAEMCGALDAGILCFNVESRAELLRLNEVATAMGKIAPVSLRVNPDVDAKTHPYISTGLKENKFGIPFAEAVELIATLQSLGALRVTGLDCHIGSQLTELSPFAEAREKMLVLTDQFKAAGFTIEHLDLGGGLGIRYQDETPPSASDYVAALCKDMAGRSERVLIEPGRALVGNCGVLLTKVEYLKPTPSKNFAVVDAAMNDLLRPALYDAYHAMLPTEKNLGEEKNYAVVGPVCETGDFLGHDRMLALSAGSLIAIMSAGAYGMSMSSNYNSRPRAAEVMVDGETAHLIRERESFEHLIAGEKLLP